MCRGREYVAASPGSCTYCLAVCVNTIQKGTWGDLWCPEQILDQCPEPSATRAYLASTVNMKIASLFHLHSEEYNKCSELVQQPVVQGQESGPTVRVRPSLPEAEKGGEGLALLELLHRLCVNMNEAATAGGDSAWPSSPGIQFRSGACAPPTMLFSWGYGLNCVSPQFICWSPNA